MTTPAMPPSRTSRFEPTPMTVTGTSGFSFSRKSARSSASAGWNRSSAGPPTRNQVNGASGASSEQPPADGGEVAEAMGGHVSFASSPGSA